MWVAALPEVPRDEVLWPCRFGVVGVITFLVSGGDPVRAVDEPIEVEATTRRLIAFLAPGIRALVRGGDAASTNLNPGPPPRVEAQRGPGRVGQ